MCLSPPHFQERGSEGPAAGGSGAQCAAVRKTVRLLKETGYAVHPVHSSPIPVWLFHEMLRQAGLSRDEFVRLLRDA